MGGAAGMGQANLICCCATKDRGQLALRQSAPLALAKSCHEHPSDSSAGAATSGADSNNDEEDPDEALAQELEAMSVNLSRAVHKYPSKGKSHRKPQSRYAAILPSYEAHSQSLLQRYEQGWLAY